MLFDHLLFKVIITLNYYMIIYIKYYSVIYNLLFVCYFNNGDWGLGIGDWAQSPVPNPQSPSNILISNIKTISYNI